LTLADATLDAPTAAPAATDARATSPAISVVIPAKNAAAYIVETIDSALGQADVTEIIVVDDGSTDDTIAIVRAIRDPRLYLVTNDASGVSAARNLGARDARGDWLMFLDADDRLRPGAVATLMATTTQSTARDGRSAAAIC
jgi:glycosyltransferase involved in cell wall biosynthesis